MTEQNAPSLAEVLETAVHFNQLDNYRHKHLVILSDEDEERIFERMRALATDFTDYVTLIELADMLKAPVAVKTELFEKGLALAETSDEIFSDLWYALEDTVPQAEYESLYAKAMDRALELSVSIRLAMDMHWKNLSEETPGAYRFFQKALQFVNDHASAKELANDFDDVEIWRFRKELHELFSKMAELGLSFEDSGEE